MGIVDGMSTEDATTTSTTNGTAPPAPPAGATTTPLNVGTVTVVPDEAAINAAVAKVRDADAKANGFDSYDAMRNAAIAKNEADVAAMTEAEKAKAEAEKARAEAAEVKATAAALIRTATAERALIRAGVAPGAATDAARLLDLPDGELTAETADAAVETLKAKPAFASLFTAVPAGPPSAVTGGAPTGTTRSGQTAKDRAQALLDSRHPLPQTA